MAKLIDCPVQKDDISEYLAGYSDFSFELRVLKLLRTKNICCDHGGHYTDPVTKKSREFDIRARINIENISVRLAIECKNIRDNFPIIISCLPRSKEESFNQVCHLEDEKPSSDPFGISLTPIALRSRAQCLTNRDQSIYPTGSSVGKSLTQVGRNSDKSITSGDSEIYEKWGQALSSLSDLVQEMGSDGAESNKPYFSLCIPILVVPDNRLWAVDYDYDGNLITSPSNIDHCSFFIGKDYSIRFNEPSYIISHLEIFTVTGFEKFIETKLLSSDGVKSLIGKK